jgi:hypothetical protein
VIDDDRVTGVRGHTAGGSTVTEQARVVVGADGRHSLIANAVRALQYYERPTLAVAYYAYWSGLPAEAFEGYIRPPGPSALHPPMMTSPWSSSTGREPNSQPTEGTSRAPARGRSRSSPTSPTGFREPRARPALSAQVTCRTTSAGHTDRAGRSLESRLPQGPDYGPGNQRRFP